jgi:hypothetical protein
LAAGGSEAGLRETVMANPKYSCFEGEIIPFEDAKLSIVTPAVKYAAYVFEGLRGYWNADQWECIFFAWRTTWNGCARR